jgi:hypothetical protein
MRKKAIKKQKNISKHIKQRRRKIKRKTPAPKNEPLWSSDLNIKENFKNLNLTYDLNKIPKISNKIFEKVVGEGTVEVEEEYSLDQIKQLNEGTFSESKAKITQDEGFWVKNLYRKYGENYSKMVMDHKVNKMQWNETQLRKKFDAYRRKFGPLDG